MSRNIQEAYILKIISGLCSMSQLIIYACVHEGLHEHILQTVPNYKQIQTFSLQKLLEY